MDEPWPERPAPRLQLPCATRGPCRRSSGKPRHRECRKEHAGSEARRRSLGSCCRRSFQSIELRFHGARPTSQWSLPNGPADGIRRCCTAPCCSRNNACGDYANALHSQGAPPIIARTNRHCRERLTSTLPLLDPDAASRPANLSDRLPVMRSATPHRPICWSEAWRDILTVCLHTGPTVDVSSRYRRRRRYQMQAA